MAGETVKEVTEEEQVILSPGGPFKDFGFFFEWTEKILEVEQR